MSKKFSLVVLLMLVTSLCFTLTVYGADNRLRVAVLPFDDGSIQGQARWWDENWKVGSGVSDELVTALFNTSKFRVIEREQIEKVLAEQNLASSGKIDSGTAARIGKILGAQILVIGKVTEFSNNSLGGTIKIPKNELGIDVKANTARVNIDARMVDTTSAEIKAAATGRGEKKQTNLGLDVNYNKLAFGSDEFKKSNLGIALRDAVTSIAVQLADQAASIEPAAPTVSTAQAVSVAKTASAAPAMISGKVATVYGNKIYLNIGTKHGVRLAKKFKVYRVLRTVKDPSTGKVLDYITEPVANISVTSVKPDSSICVVKTRINSKYRVSKNDIVKLSE